MKITNKTGWRYGVAFLILAGVGVAEAAKEARVTQIVREVNLLSEKAKARPAAVNDKVNEGTAVRTGDNSRSELTFADLTITRLGANSVFAFNQGGRQVRLDSGSILLRVPPDSGGGNIRAAAVTVGVTGTTLILETSRSGRSRLITLEGSARLGLVRYPKQVKTVRGGQMLDVPAGATTLPDPVNVNLGDVMKNHPLVTGFKPLPSRDLIAQTVRQQQGGQPVYQGRTTPGPVLIGPGLYPPGFGLPPVQVGSSHGGGSGQGSHGHSQGATSGGKKKKKKRDPHSR